MTLEAVLDAGAKVDCVNDGNEARRLFSSRQFDLCVVRRVAFRPSRFALAVMTRNVGQSGA